MQQSRGSTFLRNNSFFPIPEEATQKQRQGVHIQANFRSNSTILFLIFLLFYVYFFFGFPILRSDTVSGNREEFEKSKFTKTGVNITIVYTFTENPLSASAVKSQETKNICEHTSIPPAIYPEDHICKE